MTQQKSERPKESLNRRLRPVQGLIKLLPTSSDHYCEEFVPRSRSPIATSFIFGYSESKALIDGYRHCQIACYSSADFQPPLFAGCIVLILGILARDVEELLHSLLLEDRGVPGQGCSCYASILSEIRPSGI